MERRPTYRSRIPARGQRNPLLRRARRSAPRWQWLAAVLGLGVFGYFLYWLAGDDASDRPNVAAPAVPPPQKPEKPAPVKPKGQAKSEPVSQGADPAPKEPRFTFYTLLPEKEITLPEGEVRARKRAESLGQIKPNDYFIQVGSFYSPEDAGQVQAELRRLGVETRLEKTEIGKVLWYRVRIGPFKSMREVESVRARLRQHRIDSVVQTSKR